MPLTFGPRAIWPRGLCGAILLMAILVCAIAACATPLATRRAVISTTTSTGATGGPYLAQQVDFSPFQTCQDKPTARALNTDQCVMAKNGYKNVIDSGDCTQYKRYIYSIQAFYIATVILCFLALIACILNAFAVISSMITVILVVCALVCSLISWTLALSFYLVKHCNQGKMYDDKSFSFGPSGFLMLTVFGALICLLITLCVMEEGPHDRAGAKRSAPPPAPAPVTYVKKEEPKLVVPPKQAEPVGDVYDL